MCHKPHSDSHKRGLQKKFANYLLQLVVIFTTAITFVTSNNAKHLPTMKTQEQLALEAAEAQLVQANTNAANCGLTREERRELRDSIAGLRKAAEKANKKQALELLPNFPQSKTTRSGEGYKLALEAVIREGVCIKVGRNTGSGRYSNSVDYTTDTIVWLKANGYAYETGNDAPKGGRAGAWIRVIGRNAQ